MITDSSDEGVIVWMTGTSATDLSAFKPLFFDADMPDTGPLPRGTYTEGSLWWKHERLHRRAVADYHALKPGIRGRLRRAGTGVLRRGAGLEDGRFEDEVRIRARMLAQGPKR